MLIQPVILSGGVGSRLWPWSSTDRPKQFLPLVGPQTMLDLTLDRVADRSLFAPAMVVGSLAHEEQIAKLLDWREHQRTRLILEPAPRSTAAAIASAALTVDRETLLLIMPSDHLITDVPKFHAAIAAAMPAALEHWLLTFGMTPMTPETGYGYIKRGRSLSEGVYRAVRFVEKPDAATATAYLRSGDFLWNGGIFLFRAGAILDALASLAPDVLADATAAVARASNRGGVLIPDAEAFSSIRSISIDRAVMEKSERVAVAPVDMGWSDVGSWDALYRISGKDASNNALTDDVTIIDSTGMLVRADGAKVTCIDVHDLTVVFSHGELLIAKRGSGERVTGAYATSPPDRTML